MVEAPTVEVPALPEPEPVAVQSQPLPPLPTAAPRPVVPKTPTQTQALNKGAIDSLLGELTQVGRMGAPSLVKIEVPGDVEGDIEVVVQIRQAGQVKVEQSISRPAPKKGITAKLSVELKRG
jgi:hypothetical protein